MTDQEFKEVLRDHLSTPAAPRPIVPTIKRIDGTIDREATLQLPCYQGFEVKP